MMRAGVMTTARFSVCVLLLLSLRTGAHGGRMLDELPPCKDVSDEIPNWDCFDAPLTPLPPCNFKHQNPGIDCSTESQKPRPKEKAVVEELHTSSAAEIHVPVRTASSSEGGAGLAIKGMLPSCKDVIGGIPRWDCYDPPTTPLPPCDFKHENPGLDCWPRDPPAVRSP